MQAGDRLSTFITPFMFDEGKEVSIEKMTETLRFFLEMSVGILQKYADDVDTIEVLEESGFVTVLELSLRVTSSDGSYLHILIFGHKQGTAILDLGISIIEHGPKGEYIGGYQYVAEGIEVRRSSTRLADSEEEQDEDSTMSHFSVLDLYASRDELFELMMAEDEETKRIGLETKTAIEQDAELDAWEEEMGFDNQPIAKDELEKVEAILRSAELFPLPHRQLGGDTA
ncbi:MAG: hypothetical protein WAV04_03905 [Candidatus Microsaccharimonas sp.]